MYTVNGYENEHCDSTDIKNRDGNSIIKWMNEWMNERYYVWNLKWQKSFERLSNYSVDLRCPAMPLERSDKQAYTHQNLLILPLKYLFGDGPADWHITYSMINFNTVPD